MMLGYNYRLTDIQAAIGIEQLKKLDKFNKKRIQNAKIYNKELKGIVETPLVSKNIKHVFHQYTIITKKRDKLQKFLKSKKIGTVIYYPFPIYKHPLYKKFNYKTKLKNTEKFCKETLSLPVHPSVSKKNIIYISNQIKKFFR